MLIFKYYLQLLFFLIIKMCLRWSSFLAAFFCCRLFQGDTSWEDCILLSMFCMLRTMCWLLGGYSILGNVRFVMRVFLLDFFLFVLILSDMLRTANKQTNILLASVFCMKTPNKILAVFDFICLVSDH